MAGINEILVYINTARLPNFKSYLDVVLHLAVNSVMLNKRYQIKLSTGFFFYE
jgi:hypothetical protein